MVTMPSIIDYIKSWEMPPEIAWKIVCMHNYETGIDRLKAYYERIHK